MNRFLKFAAIASAVLFTGTAASAQACPVDILDPFDLEAADIDSIYACMEAQMVAAYSKQGNKIGENYRNWTITASRPGVAGAHGERLLLTWANPIGAEQYLKYQEEGFEMPAGSVLAKESIKINKKKKAAVVGPLFLMTKLKPGEAPEAGDWRYDAIAPNGKQMKIKQAFCNDCHKGYEDSDYLAYPIEEVRLSD